MKVVLIRHAQKGITPFENPELTAGGHQQALQLSQSVQKKILVAPTQLWSSPKIRALQTLKPLSLAYQIDLQIVDLLDQRNENETASEFRNRIVKSIALLDEASVTVPEQVYFLCTHYDWIEEALDLINCDKDLNSFEYSHWSPSQYILFEIENNIWKLIKKGGV